ncbi:hydantoin racemase [Colletotrichum graminicola]|uniref:Hydantoin racemase n=1 Tax=Colletotrichum graminicola (strain M1.001 / M2 / FGSC 10212) TaxID=645133 RepID=E3QKT8_COLGM|nr:hydantoin racemase [Colletotrichum graminicola M1.001]EFQ31476.1 hydantoin racemase [Colletotrichum graminicola M1.001]WDK19786.1 hydantoin racemase [Colletotrichum graminicola]
MTTRVLRRNIKILVINPNSSEDMTRGMERAIQAMPLHDSLEIHTYTAPSESPASINDDVDIQLSTEVVVKDLVNSGKLDQYDGVLIACYSVHSLVEKLSRQFHSSLAVTGIFEASILAATALLPHSSTASYLSSKWGIVTTGDFWERHLGKGVKGYLGQAEESENVKFGGVTSTGLTAGDFHHVSPAEVRGKLEQATKKLLGNGDVRCVVMGCAGMAGLEDIIRSSAIDVYGESKGRQVFVIDGVRAGILQLEQTIRSRRLFQI